MKKIFYEKVGRKYIPILEYNYELSNSLPCGTHMITVYPGGQSTRYKIDPALAPMIAAGRVAEDAISKAIIDASDLRPSKKPITEGQRQAWENLSKEFGDEIHMLHWPSAREACEEAVKAMQSEANKLMTNPAVKLAYDHFIMVCELTKDNQNESKS